MWVQIKSDIRLGSTLVFWGTDLWPELAGRRCPQSGRYRAGADVGRGESKGVRRQRVRKGIISRSRESRDPHPHLQQDLGDGRTTEVVVWCDPAHQGFSSLFEENTLAGTVDVLLATSVN